MQLVSSVFKIAAIFMAIIGICMFTSCKKSYECDCKQTTTDGQSGTTNTDTYKFTSSKKCWELDEETVESDGDIIKIDCEK